MSFESVKNTLFTYSLHGLLIRRSSLFVYLNCLSIDQICQLEVENY